MKRLLLLAIVLFGAVNAWAEEGSKEFKKSFPAASINELTVTNRYGNIDVKQEGDEFSITTSVWVEAKTKAKVDEILEYISITAKEQGAVLNVETLFQKDMSLRQMFAGVTVSVDYHIKVPKGKKVRLVCTEGGASVADFVGDMNVEIVSGNFKANSVTGGEFSAAIGKSGSCGGAEASRRPRTAVFVSGGGTNLQALLDKRGSVIKSGDIALVVSNKPDAFALQRAKNAGVEAVYLPQNRQDPALFETAARKLLEEREIDVVVLAGFLARTTFIQQEN